MAQKTDAELLIESGIIKNETTKNANTATRVGQMLDDIIDSKFNKSYKVYTAILNYGDLSNPIILENTLGEDIIWTASETYQINGTTTNSIFTENKTIGFCYSGADGEDSYLGFLVIRYDESLIRLIEPSAYHYGSPVIRLEIRVYN